MSNKIDHEKQDAKEKVEKVVPEKVKTGITKNGSPMIYARGVTSVEEFLAEVRTILTRNKITHIYSPTLMFNK